MQTYESRSLHDIAEVIKHADGECVFLVGAGVSKSAGIPLAVGLLQEIERDFPNAFARARDKSYNSVMAELTSAQRSKLLCKHMENAKVNWAHLALAQMFHLRKIDRILTVNFDPLIMRACAMVGEFPAVYDLAAAQDFKPARIAPRSVFYLNGQHTGFTILNADEELQNHRQRLRQIVDNTGTHRIWVVLGYSGAADPLLDVLAEVPMFDNGLYWIGTRPTPSSQVMEKLLRDRSKQAYFLGGQQADDFLKELAQELECFPPPLLSKPFDHIEKIIAHIDFDTGGDEGRAARANLLQQIADSRAGEVDEGVDLMALLMAGRQDQVLLEYQKLVQPNERQQQVAAWALLRQGRLLEEEAKRLADSDLERERQQAQQCWTVAAQKYGAALQIKPDMYEALCNWGQDLAEAACALAGSDLQGAGRKWALATEKFARALEIVPDNHLVLQRWGSALLEQGQALAALDLSQAQEKWREAEAKFLQAIQIDPQFYLALTKQIELLLLQLHYASDGAQRQDLLARAKHAALQAEEIQKGAATAQLARIHALLGESGRAMQYLQQIELAAGQEVDLASDSAFEQMHELDDWKRWVAGN